MSESIASAPDVLVIGGGAIGVAAAYELADRGVDVTLVEASSGVGSECSYGNAGLISPSHCIPLARPGLLARIPGWLRAGGAVHVRPRASTALARFAVLLARSCGEGRMLTGLRTLRDLSRASRDLFEDITRSGIDFGYRRDGLINICRTQSEMDRLRADAELLTREGFEPEVLGPEDAHRLEPSLRSDVAGGVFWAEDAHCDPGRLVSALARAAQLKGARVELGARVSGFEMSHIGSIDSVHTTRGTLRPATVVLAAGAWTAKLARLVGSRLPLEPGRGYHVHLSGRDLPLLKRPLIFQESVFAATPLGGELRLAGTMEFAGMDLSLDEDKAARLLREARFYLPGLEQDRPQSLWCGLRPCTPDSLPLLGRSTRVPNLVFATGHAMLGITLAPLSGRVVADLVVSGGTEFAVGPLSPARYRA